jgi:hypothetical protein
MAEFLEMDNQAIRLLVMEALHTWRLNAEVQIEQWHAMLEQRLDTIQQAQPQAQRQETPGHDASHDHEAAIAITRTSLWSGITRTLDLPITSEQLDRWAGGMPIQEAMPHLTTAEREFVVSGMISEEWEELGRMEAALNGETDASDLGELHQRMNTLQQEQHRGQEQEMGL